MKQSDINKEVTRKALRKYIADLADQHECFLSMQDIDDLTTTVLDRFLDSKVKAAALRQNRHQLPFEVMIHG